MRGKESVEREVFWWGILWDIFHFSFYPVFQKCVNKLHWGSLAAIHPANTSPIPIQVGVNLVKFFILPNTWKIEAMSTLSVSTLLGVIKSSRFDHSCHVFVSTVTPTWTSSNQYLSRSMNLVHFSLSRKKKHSFFLFLGCFSVLYYYLWIPYFHWFSFSFS